MASVLLYDPKFGFGQIAPYTTMSLGSWNQLPITRALILRATVARSAHRLPWTPWIFGSITGRVATLRQNTHFGLWSSFESATPAKESGHVLEGWLSAKPPLQLLVLPSDEVHRPWRLEYHPTRLSAMLASSRFALTWKHASHPPEDSAPLELGWCSTSPW